MQNSPDKVVAILLFVNAVMILFLHALIETGKVLPDSKGSNYSLVFFVGIIVLILSFLFFGRARRAKAAQINMSEQTYRPESAGRLIKDFIIHSVTLFVAVVLIFMILWNFGS